MTTRMIIVGGNKGGVGKTTVARLLLERHGAPGWRVFDGQAPGGSLRRFQPDAEIVEFASTLGRMHVLDGLADRITLVDLPAGLLSETLQMLEDARFLSDVAAQRVKLTVVHVVGPSVDSMGEAADVAARLAEGGDHVLVRNAANDEAFQYDARAYDKMLALVAPATRFDLPHLDGAAREAVDLAGMPYGAFATDPARSAFLRRLVIKWQSDCDTAMESAGLGRFVG